LRDARSLLTLCFGTSCILRRSAASLRNHIYGSLQRGTTVNMPSFVDCVNPGLGLMMMVALEFV
jgi:hypothetical protein